MNKKAKPMPKDKRRKWESTIDGGKRSAEKGNPFWDVCDAKASKCMLDMWGRR